MPRKALAKASRTGAVTAKASAHTKLAKSGMIRARISPDLKAEVKSMLDQTGLTPSDAIRMFYKQVTLCKGLPFDARIPNAATRKALRDAEAGRNLTDYADADDLFEKLALKRGQS